MALELQPQEVLSLVDAYDPRALPGLDPVGWADEAQHIAHLIARRATLLFLRQVLPHHDPRLDALPLHVPGLDQRFPDPVVEVPALSVARSDHDAATAVRDEIPRDSLVPHAGVRDLHDTAGLLEKPHRLPDAAGFGGSQDGLAEPRVALPADHVEVISRDSRAVDEKGEGRACFHGAVLLTVTHEHDLRPHFLGPVKQLPRLTARQEACFVQDPELRLSAGREGLLERRGDRDAINGGFLQDGRCRRRGREAAYLPTRLFGMLADEGQGPGLAGPCFALDGNEPIRTGEDVPRGAQLILAQATRRLG